MADYVAKSFTNILFEVQFNARFTIFSNISCKINHICVGIKWKANPPKFDFALKLLVLSKYMPVYSWLVISIDQIDNLIVMLCI